MNFLAKHKNTLFSSKLIASAIALCSVLGAVQAQATEYTLTGTISRLLVKHPDITTNGLSGGKVFLNTTESAGNCPKDSAGQVIMWIREDAASERMYTTLLAAKLSSQIVLAVVDDTKFDPLGVCFLQKLQIQ